MIVANMTEKSTTVSVSSAFSAMRANRDTPVTRSSPRTDSSPDLSGKRLQALERTLAPARFELWRHRLDHRVAKRRDIRLDHGHPALREGVDQLALLLDDLGIRGRDGFRESGLHHRPVGVGKPAPELLVHDHKARRDDVRGQHQELLHFENLRRLDRRKRILLAVDELLLEREIELAEVDRRRPRAPGFGHRVEYVDRRHAQLETHHVLRLLDRLARGSELPRSV